MNRKIAIVLAAALLALPLAGCVENMADLRERVQTQAATDDTDLEPSGNGGNETETQDEEEQLPPPRPPVARINIFSESGMRIYQADFEAANQSEPVLVTDPGSFSLLGGESQPMEGDAELVGFEWSVNGERLNGRQVDVNLTDPGVHMITLSVTDSLGSVDEQFVHLGIRAEPFTVSSLVTGGAVVGATGEDPSEGQAPMSETQSFTVEEEVDGKPVRVQQVRVELDANPRVEGQTAPTADAVLTLTNPDGESMTRDSAGHGGVETLVIEPGKAGEWQITVTMGSGFTDEWRATVDVTYVEVVPELESAGDGHDGHDHQH